MIVSRWRPFESMRCSCRLTAGEQIAGDALQQHVRVAEDRVERRPELVRHVGEELRLQPRRLFELDRLPPEQLVLRRQLGGGRLDARLQFVRRRLQLLVQPRALERLAPVVQDGDDGRQLAGLGQHLAGDGFDGNRLAVTGFISPISPRRISPGPVSPSSRPEMNDEKCASLACTVRCAMSLALGQQREQILGRRVHQHRGAGRIGHDDRIGDRVDDQVQPIALGAHRRFGDAQLLVVLLDLLGRAPQVGDVAQHRDDAGALARILDGRASRLEQQVRSVARVDQQQLARLLRCLRRPMRDSAAENSMLFSSTARRRPSLSSSLAANSFSARALATISRPSVSVSMIGSVTR